MIKLMKKLHEAKQKENEMKEARLEIEAEIYTKIESQLNDDKTLTFKEEGFKLSVKPSYAVSVNQELAANYPLLFKAKFEMSYSAYKKCEYKDQVNEIVTIKINKPSFQIEVV